MPTASLKPIRLQKLHDQVKRDNERYEKTEKILHDEKKNLAEKLQDPAVQNLYKKLIQREVNQLMVFGKSNDWNNLPDGVKEQLNNQHEDLLKELEIRELTPEQEKKFQFNDVDASKILYENPQAAIANENLRRAQASFNMPIVLAGISQIRLVIAAGQNVSSVAVYTKWGNYFGQPTNILKYMENLTRMVEKASFQSKNLYVEEEEATVKSKPAPEKMQMKPATGEKEVSDHSEQKKSTQMPKLKPNPFKTNPY